MTFRLRSITRRARPANVSPEDRQAFLVTAGFVGLIGLVVLTLVAAVGVGYYNDHLKPIANVGGTQITRDDWAERARLTLFRIDRAQRRVREAMAAAELDATTGAQRLQALSTARNDAPAQSIEELIDLIHQGQLASAMGLAVSEAEIDEATAREASTPERRRVQAIFVEPERDSASADPSAAQRREALARAEAALAALEAGDPFEEVAREYSTDISRENGGDYGVITDANPSDEAWVEALFKLEEGATTEIVKGADGTYRIGRVREVLAGTSDPAFAEELREEGISDGVYRENVQRELLAGKLRDSIVADATRGDVEQVRLSEIVILISQTGDEQSGEGEVRAAHILYSPKDDPQNASAVPPEDPAWAEAEQAARAADAELRAIEDVDARIAAFEARAKGESDDRGSGENGGDLGFFSRDLMVPEFADPLFDIPRTPGEIVGPVRSEFGYHVILFHELRPPADERIDAVLEALEAPDADFAEIAREHSDGDEAEDGGDIGWIARGQLPEEAEEAVFALDAGETTGSLELDDGYHVYKVEEKARRPVDAEQRALIEASAFDEWYDPKKRAAEDAGQITRDAEVFGSPDEIVGEDETLP